MDDLFDEFGNFVSSAAELGLGAAVFDYPDAPASPPAAAAPLRAANAPQPARARAPAKCSLCLAAGITVTSHTKAKCPRNVNALNRIVVDGSAIPGALSHRALPPHFDHSRQAPVLEPIVPEAVLVEPLDAPSSSDRSSDTDAPAMDSGNESGSSDDDHDGEFAPSLFDDAVWVPHILLPQAPLPVLQPQHELRSSVFIGPLPPPVFPMFGGEVPSFIRPNEKGVPRNIPATCSTAWQFIDLLFTEESWVQLCTFTNLAATTMPRHQRKCRLARWKPITVVEMRMFFAVASFLGVVGIQNRKASWSRSRIFGQPFLHGCMSLRRFESIVSCLHYEDSWTMGPDALKAANERDCFWQIHGLVNDVSRRAKIYWKMGRKISIDEAVIPFKGRHRGRCYNPKKPAKYHFKTFAMNDADTGYQYHSYFYRGKEESRPADVPATMWPVVTMVQASPEIQNAGHVLATDNWYTQPQLTDWLKAHGIESVGTCKSSRLHVVTPKRPVGFPRGGIFKAKFGGKKERGFSMVHETTVADRKYYVTSWQDKKSVYMLSSYPPSQGKCFRKIKVGRTWTEQVLPRPSVVRHYNAGMGGTDLHDQRLSTFRSTLKSRRWQVRTLTNTFQSVCMNAFILQKTSINMGKTHTSLDFIESMIAECANMQLAEENQLQSPGPDSPSPFDGHKRAYWLANPTTRCVGRHFLHQMEGSSLPDVVGSKRKDNRRQCMVCADRCLTFCRQCGVHLCIGSCNETFHTCNNF
jgi:hypothetical protein